MPVVLVRVRVFRFVLLLRHTLECVRACSGQTALNETEIAEEGAPGAALATGDQPAPAEGADAPKEGYAASYAYFGGAFKLSIRYTERETSPPKTLRRKMRRRS